MGAGSKLGRHLGIHGDHHLPYVPEEGDDDRHGSRDGLQDNLPLVFPSNGAA